MINIIRIHNYLNGFKFSAIEFIVASLIVVPFTLYYLINGNLFYAVLSLGLIINFLVMVGFACQSIKRNEKDFGIRNMFSKEGVRSIHEKYSNLGTVTLLLCVTIIIPYLLPGLVSIEKIRKGF